MCSRLDYCNALFRGLSCFNQNKLPSIQNTHMFCHSHPERQYLTVLPFHSSRKHSSKQFGLSFAFDAPKIWNDLPTDVCYATSITSFRKKVQSWPVCESLFVIASLSPLYSFVMTLLRYLSYDYSHWFCLVAP